MTSAAVGRMVFCLPAIPPRRSLLARVGPGVGLSARCPPVAPSVLWIAGSVVAHYCLAPTFPPHSRVIHKFVPIWF